MLKYCYILLLSVVMVSFASCSDDDDVRVPDQLFRPAVFEADVQMDYVVLSWIPIKGATYYLEVSKDELLFQADLQKYNIKDASEFILDNLEAGKLYSARIKSVSIDPDIQDSEYAVLTFTPR